MTGWNADSEQVEVCPGGADGAWRAVYTEVVPPQSCKHLLDEDASLPDGKYDIAPGGGGTFAVYCDMARGGWTLFYRHATNTRFGLAEWYGTEGSINAASLAADGPGANSDGRLSRDQMNRLMQPVAVPRNT